MPLAPPVIAATGCSDIAFLQSDFARLLVKNMTRPETKMPTAPTQSAAAPVPSAPATIVNKAPPMMIPGWLIAPIKVTPVARQLTG